MPIKQCLILIGGLGTRLGELTATTPKPLLKVADRPFVEYLIFEAARRGLTNIVLLAGRHYEKVLEYVQTTKISDQFQISIQISIETSPLGTGGAVALARDLLEDEFLLVNGDTWFDFNWLDLAARCRNENFGAGMSLRSTAHPDRYETVDLDGAHIRTLQRRNTETNHGLINAGVYYLTRDAASKIVAPSSLETNFFPALAKQDRLGGFAYEGFFIDIGLPDTYASAQSLVPARTRRPAVFFDRDGVLNVDQGYVHRPEHFHWIPGAREAIKHLNDLGYYVFVVTNQAGVAHGFYAEQQVKDLHTWMLNELRRMGAWIDDWRYCPFHAEGKVEAYRQAHSWRKPSPGMILDILRCWPIELEQSFLVGDQQTDIEAATAANLNAFLYSGGDLQRFVDKIVSNNLKAK